MRNDQGDQEYSETPPVRRCGHCGAPLLTQRRRAKYCSREHKELAREARKRASDRLITLRENHPFADVTRDETLTEMHAHAAKRDWRDDPRNFSDFGEVSGDYELAAAIDAEDEAAMYHGDDESEPEWAEQDSRFNAMLQANEDRRRPRRSWFDLKKLYNRNPGIEQADITEERVQGHKAEQAATRARLRNNPRQPQDRFNEVTKDVVANRSTESRRLNHVFATADPRRVSQRQEFSFEAEQTTWDAYRGGPGGGYRSRSADYARRVDDGFRF